ncbi:MAG TPA: ABC transporter permease [Dehalococcoidia bacterium]|nr:ABC transporter permease [Dehalococcoidia bacterium]
MQQSSPATTRFPAAGGAVARLAGRSHRAQFVAKQPLATAGGLLVLAIILCALLAPRIAPYGYATGQLSHALEGPSSSHPLGTDWVGRDVLSRIIYGARSAVLVGFGASGAALLLAALLGVAGSYYRHVDLGLQRLLDIWLSIPALILVLTALSVFGTGLVQIIICVAVVLAAGASRIIRSRALAVAHTEYVSAAKATGASDLRVLSRHILPNVAPTIIVVSTAQVGTAVLIEATLGFLGYGIPPPTPTWGQMLSIQGMAYFSTKPLLAIWPGLAIVAAVFGFNVLGDGLRDRLDPRMRGRR